MKIWKWTMSMNSGQIISMPKGAKILAIQTQGGLPQLWALVDDENPDIEQRSFSIYGTGHDMPNEPGTYVGTFQLRDGNFVFHVFEHDQP